MIDKCPTCNGTGSVDKANELNNAFKIIGDFLDSNEIAYDTAIETINNDYDYEDLMVKIYDKCKKVSAYERM
jgi:DnaJ-class molecular chaperone